MDEPVVALSEVEPFVAQVTLQDEAGKNGFSPALMEGLTRAFDEIRTRASHKAVILTGRGSAFATGGTREGLLAMQAGAVRFTDASFYSLPLECEVPVIAAMQGHAIGGGFALGLFADIVILAREAVYSANFMQYGFTPGMGATCVVPRKLGLALGEEMLLNGGRYRGEELERRGVPFAVLPRAQVQERARELARELADKPRTSLVALKAHLVAELRRELPRVIAQEAALHERTFPDPEVKQRIVERFGS